MLGDLRRAFGMKSTAVNGQLTCNKAMNRVRGNRLATTAVTTTSKRRLSSPKEIDVNTQRAIINNKDRTHEMGNYFEKSLSMWRGGKVTKLEAVGERHTSSLCGTASPTEDNLNYLIYSYKAQVDSGDRRRRLQAAITKLALTEQLISQRLEKNPPYWRGDGPNIMTPADIELNEIATYRDELLQLIQQLVKVQKRRKVKRKRKRLGGSNGKGKDSSVGPKRKVPSRK